jgi:F0F1-type ATP synthase assembly protein I
MENNQVITKALTKNDLENFSQYRISFFLKISMITLVNTLVFFGIGFALDNLMNTKPIYTIIFVVAAFPVLQLILYKNVRKHN